MHRKSTSVSSIYVLSQNPSSSICHRIMAFIFCVAPVKVMHMRFLTRRKLVNCAFHASWIGYITTDSERKGKESKQKTKRMRFN